MAAHPDREEQIKRVQQPKSNGDFFNSASTRTANLSQFKNMRELMVEERGDMRCSKCRPSAGVVQLRNKSEIHFYTGLTCASMRKA